MVRRSEGAERTFSGGVVPANAQRAPSLPEKPLQTMPNRVHILWRLTYSIFPGKAQSSSGFSSEYTTYCARCTGLCLGSDRSEHHITSNTCQVTEFKSHLSHPFSCSVPRADVSTSLFPKIRRERSLCFVGLTAHHDQHLLSVKPQWQHHIGRQNPLRSVAINLSGQPRTTKGDGRKKMTGGHPPDWTAHGEQNTEHDRARHGRAEEGQWQGGAEGMDFLPTTTAG